MLPLSEPLGALPALGARGRGRQLPKNTALLYAALGKLRLRFLSSKHSFQWKIRNKIIVEQTLAETYIGRWVCAVCFSAFLGANFRVCRYFIPVCPPLPCRWCSLTLSLSLTLHESVSDILPFSLPVSLSLSLYIYIYIHLFFSFSVPVLQTLVWQFVFSISLSLSLCLSPCSHQRLPSLSPPPSLSCFLYWHGPLFLSFSKVSVCPTLLNPCHAVSINLYVFIPLAWLLCLIFFCFCLPFYWILVLFFAFRLSVCPSACLSVSLPDYLAICLWIFALPLLFLNPVLLEIQIFLLSSFWPPCHVQKDW